MSKKKHISAEKRATILSHEIRNTSVKGVYHSVKLSNPTYLLSAIRLGMPIENYSIFLEGLQKFPSDIEITGNKKKKVQDILQNILSFKSFDSEFFWAKNILNPNLPKIQNFLSFKEEYSKHLLFGRYVEAEQILDEIEQFFGFSIWLIKNRISLYQLASGLEEQKRYSNNLKSKLRSGSITRFLIHWISIRNESKTSVGRFKAQTEQILSKLHPDRQSGFREFLSYHLFDSNFTSIDDLIQVVRLSYSASLIDYYESFISLLKAMVLSPDVVKKAKAIGFITGYPRNLDDVRLNNLALFAGVNLRKISLDNVSVEAYENILKGDFERAFEVSEKEILRENSLTINIILNAYSKSFLAKPTYDKIIEDNPKEKVLLINNVISSLCEVLKKGIVDASKEFNELNKIVINYPDSYWTTAIKLITAREFALNGRYATGMLPEIMNLRIAHPLVLEHIDVESFYNIYEQICLTNYGARLCLNYHKSIKDLEEISPKNLFPAFYLYGNGLISFHSNEFEKAIHYSEYLNSLGISFFMRKSYGIMTHSYFKNANYKQACILAANIYVKEKNYYPFLPLEELSSVIFPGTSIWKECNSLIELSILLDACFKHISKSKETSRRFAYEDYLLEIGLEKPSQIRPIISDLDIEKVTYYLRYICLESTMDTSVAFAGGSNEVIEERLQICRILLEIDARNESAYRQEIKEIVRRQVIASRRQEVDQSRVYVDVNSIKDWAETELEESYYRYITYLKTGLDSQNTTSKTHVGERLSVIDVPDDEVNELLTFMVEEIRSSYLSSDIGLDRFISTRIRHGELERTMRIPIQKHNLITKKELKAGPYLPNQYWLERIEGTPDVLDKVDFAFKKFSEDYDNLIAKIANEWLQIKSGDKPNGLFDITFSTPDILRIADSIDASTNLNQFIDLVIRYLDNGLILILVNIRDVLNSNGKGEAKTLLNKLYESISQDSSVSNIELTRAITQARTDLTAQFDKIIEWFVPSTEGNSAPYTIEDAIMVAEAIIKEATPNFKIEIVKNDDEEYSIHGQLPIFVDIFINSFENVIKRSGLPIPSAQIELHYEDMDDEHFSIHMKISNKLGDSIDLESTKSILNEIKEKLAQNAYSKYVATEKNSGLIKIFKSINDFSVIGSDLKPSMDFGIFEDRFEMNIRVPFKIFRLEGIEEENIS